MAGGRGIEVLLRLFRCCWMSFVFVFGTFLWFVSIPARILGYDDEDGK